MYLLSKKYYILWLGKKKIRKKAIELSKKHNTSFTLLEDGFIRSLDLGIKNSPSFSIVEDNIGIYYDATTSSKLENMLNTYNFKVNQELMKKAFDAIELIKKYHISKYNNAPDIDENYFKNDLKKES